jgi:uncharacterized LabA/DUF88 family protein
MMTRSLNHLASITQPSPKTWGKPRKGLGIPSHETLLKGSAIAGSIGVTATQGLLMGLFCSSILALVLAKKQNLDTRLESHMQQSRQVLTQQAEVFTQMALEVEDVQERLADLDASCEALHDRSTRLGTVLEMLQQIEDARTGVRGRVGVFIDGGALRQASLKLGFKVDFKRIKEWVSAGADSASLNYFTLVDATPGQQRFLNLVRQEGYRVISKIGLKPNLDAEIAPEMLCRAEMFDTVVFIGREELKPVLQSLSHRGIRVEVINVEPDSELRDIADQFVELAALKQQVELT